MKIKNIIYVLVSLILTVSLLSGCALFSGASLPGDIDEKGNFVYSIVRGEDSSQSVGDSAKLIRSAIKDNLGGKAAFVKDSVVENVKGSCEILVGNTNRAESAKALAVITENRQNNAFDFIIKVIDNKICIQATNDQMIDFACKCFVETFCQSAETWSLLTKNYEYLYTPKTASPVNTVAGQNVGYFTFVKPVSQEFIIGKEIEDIIELYANYGYSINYIEDMDEAKEYEILVGDTTREESKSVTVEGDNYIIKVVGKKLVVKGGNTLSTWRAIRKLYEIFYNKNETIAWTDGYVINGKYDAEEDGAYTLNFFDEFDASVVNKNVWGDNNYAAQQTQNASTLGGTMWQIDIDGNTLYEGYVNPNDFIYQSDGSLALGSGRISEKDFMKSAVSTFNSMLYKYGHLEVRAKLPGKDYSAGLWLNGTGEQGLVTRYGDLSRCCMTEIDLMENYGGILSYGSNIHRWWSNYTADGQSTYQGHNTIGGDSRYHTKENNADFKFDSERYGGDLSTDFHIYSFYWDDGQIKFAFDGKSYMTYDFNDELSVSVHCIMDYLIFSNMTGNASYGSSFKVGETAEYAEMRIDYVRLYQTDAFGSQMVKGDGQYVNNVNPNNTVIVYPEHSVTNSY